MGKVQRYSEGLYQWCMWHEMCGRQRRKGSEEVGLAVAEKLIAFEEMLQIRDRYDRYRDGELL